MNHKMSLILCCTLIALMFGGNQAVGVSAGNSGKTLIRAPNASVANSEEKIPWAPVDHNHLGQTWTGSDPLVINGTYGEPWYAPLVLSNDSGDGLRILSAARRGVVVDSATRVGFYVGSAGTHGLFVESAGKNGLFVESAGMNGLFVESAGSTGVSLGEVGGDGIWVGSAGQSGLFVESAGSLGVGVGYAKEVAYWVNRVDGNALWADEVGSDGIALPNVGGNGMWVGSAGGNGVQVDSAGVSGFSVQNAVWNGVQVDSAYDGVIVDSAKHTGFGVRSAGASGLWVANAGDHGVAVYSATNEGVLVGSAGDNGLYVQNAGNNGVAVESASTHGLKVANAGVYGVEVQNAGAVGLYVGSTGDHGLYVANAGNNGVHVNSAVGYAGWFGGPIVVNGGCNGCTITMFGVNSGDVPLQPGDIVSIQGLLPSQFAEAATLMQVKAAEKGETIIGVVQGRAEVNRATDSQQGNSEDHLVPRQGKVEPDDYVTIIIFGPAQVKASALSGPISAGTRLTRGDDGGVRTLKTTEVNGVQIAESTSTIGIALEGQGVNELIWVLVNPQ